VTRSEEPETRREQILAGAARAIARNGFDHVRLRDVAAEAGVSVGMLQHYFATREQLGREAFAYVCRARATRFAEAAVGATTSWDRIELYLRHALDWSDVSDRARTWLDLASAASRDPLLREQAALSFEIWREPLETAITDGVSNGEFAPVVPPRAAVDALLALIDGTEVRIVADTVDSGDVVNQALDTALTIARLLLQVGEPSGAPTPQTQAESSR
jgi:AcrR family transcriptional regulator